MPVHVSLSWTRRAGALTGESGLGIRSEGHGLKMSESPPEVRDEVNDGDRFVAVRARATGTDPAAEAQTVRAALLTEEASQADRTFINDGSPGQTGRERRERSGLTSSPGGLTAGVRAVTTPTGGVKSGSTDRAGHR